MKKFLLVVVHILILGTWSAANSNGFGSGLVPAAPSAWLQQKTIKDQVEYNGYISALNMTDAAANAAAMEAFASKYAASGVRIDALKQAMAADQPAANMSKGE